MIFLIQKRPKNQPLNRSLYMLETSILKSESGGCTTWMNIIVSSEFDCISCIVTNCNRTNCGF